MTVDTAAKHHQMLTFDSTITSVGPYLTQTLLACSTNTDRLECINIENRTVAAKQEFQCVAILDKYGNTSFCGGNYQATSFLGNYPPPPVTIVITSNCNEKKKTIPTL